MKKLLILATLIYLSIVANATVLYVDSDTLSTINNSTHATVDLSGTLHPSPKWAAAFSGSQWISYGSTGDPTDPGFFSPPNGTVMTFSTTFILTGAITGGYLRVMADDSTSVVLNGHTLMTANLTPGSRCSSTPIGCMLSTEGIFMFSALAPYLVDGSNTFSFGVVQVSGSSFGLDFAGSVETSATPEPGTLALIAGGLLVFAILRHRK
jgi:hypothetical protein